MEQVTLPLVLVTAAVDSINPCAIGVLVFLVSTLMRLWHDRSRMLLIGFIYIAAVYITYFLAGLGLIWFVQKWQITTEVSIMVGGLIILLGLVEVKDFFWYGRGFSLAINPVHIERIKRMARHATIPGVIVLGFFVAAVELPCTGGPYLAITTILSRNPFNIQALLYLLLYNFIFVLPLLLIVLAVYCGTRIRAIQEWKQGSRKWMRLATGLLMMGLGVLLIMYAV